MKILFITWDGNQTNYLESLFLPIFVRLKECGIYFHIIQFSWKNTSEVNRIKEVCKSKNIPYQHMRIYRTGPVALSSFFSILIKYFSIRKLVDKWRITAVMPRSIYPAFIYNAILSKKHLKFIYDADGLSIDERVEFSGLNQSSAIFNLLRYIELQSVIKSDSVLVRTPQAKQVLSNRAGLYNPSKFKLVANGRDSNKFKLYSNSSNLAVRSRLGIASETFIIVYCGSLGKQYCVEEMFYFYKKVKERIKSCVFLILSQDHDNIELHYDKYKDDDSVIIKNIPHVEIPKYLSACDLALAIRSQSFSMTGVQPIKIGEYLMCGLPIIVTKNVGNTSIIPKEMGYVLENNGKECLAESLNWLATQFNTVTKEDIAKFGVSEYSLEKSILQYQEALTEVK